LDLLAPGFSRIEKRIKNQKENTRHNVDQHQKPPPAPSLPKREQLLPSLQPSLWLAAAIKIWEEKKKKKKKSTPSHPTRSFSFSFSSFKNKKKMTTEDQLVDLFKGKWKVSPVSYPHPLREPLSLQCSFQGPQEMI